MMLRFPLYDTAMAAAVAATPRSWPSPTSFGCVGEGRLCRSNKAPLGLTLSASVGGDDAEPAASKENDDNKRASRLLMVEEAKRLQFFTGSSLVKPLVSLYPRRPCRLCGGARGVLCDVCEGRGRLNKGGYHKRNPISLERIVGSKWTAMESTMGWRHFRVRSKSRTSGKDWFVEMSATCDETTRLWVNLRNLKDRELWSMGWLQKTEILNANNESQPSLVCKACKGEGRQPCRCTKQKPGEPTVDLINV